MALEHIRSNLLCREKVVGPAIPLIGPEYKYINDIFVVYFTEVVESLYFGPSMVFLHKWISKNISK